MNVDEVRGRATITVPEAAQLLGVGQDVLYRAAQAGELPTLKLGRRLLVPVPRLLAMLGADTHEEVPTNGAATPGGDPTKDLLGHPVIRSVTQAEAVNPR